MTRCSSCGKAIEKVPTWLQVVTVDFVCNNCPNRVAKNVSFVTLEKEVIPGAAVEEDVDLDEVPDPAEA